MPTDDAPDWPDEVTPGAVEDVLATAFPDRPVTGVTDCSGMAHATYAATLGAPRREVVVACCVHDHLAARFAVEAPVTRLVGRETDLPVAPMLADSPTAGAVPWPYWVAGRLPGESPRNRFYDGHDLPPETVRQAGRLLGRLHAATAGEFGAPARLRRTGTGEDVPDDADLTADGDLALDRGPWSTMLADLAREQIDQLAALEGFAFADLLPAVRESVEAHLPSLGDPEETVLCHHDYRPANCLFADGDVTGVVDWERALVGPPAYDLAKAEWNFADAPGRAPADRRPLREALRAGYREVRALPAGWPDRQDRYCYRFLHALELLWAYPVWRDRVPPERRDAVESGLRKTVERTRSALSD
ncbi:MAG: phosphotransferase family protein [Halobacteriaceae archaeon]